MLSKKNISEIRSLHNARERKDQKLFIAEGEKIVKELLLSDFKVRLVAGLPEFLNENNSLLTGIETHEISVRELERISSLVSPNLVLAVAEIPVVNYQISNHQLLVIADGISDPGNLGTIIRTCDWFGVKQLFCSIDSVDCYNSKVVQSSMGSIFRTSVYYSEPAAIIKEATQNGFTIVGATLDGMSVNEYKKNSKSLLIIGSESHGISEEVISLCDVNVAVPKQPGSKAESLNAAVACGILLERLTALNKKFPAMSRE
jgi:RNA methyltransferase, TrmH family